MAVVKIRISGTKTECAQTVALLKEACTVREASGFYPNRGSDVVGRVYVDVELPRCDSEE